MAHIEATTFKDIPSANRIYASIVKLAPSISHYMAWISLIFTLGDLDKCREIYQMASRRHLPGAEELYLASITFEERYGDLTTLATALDCVCSAREADARLAIFHPAVADVPMQVAAPKTPIILKEEVEAGRKRVRENLDADESRKLKRTDELTIGEENKTLGDISTYKMIEK